MTAADRFWAKVEVTPEGGCWLWRGARNGDGYGVFGAGGRGKLVLAHRWAYEAARGAIPEGLTVDHSCAVRNCVRVEHLSVVTAQENRRRAYEKLGGLSAAMAHARAGRARRAAQNSEATALRLWAACAGGVLGAVEAEGEGAAAATTHNTATQVRGKGAVREANGAAAEGKRGVWAAHERVLTYEGAGPLIFPIALLGPNGARAVPANASKGEALKAGEGGHLRVGEAGAASAGECGGAVPNAHAAQVGDGVDVNAAPHQHNSHSQQSTHGAQSPPSPRALETAQLCMGLGVPGAGVGA